MSAVVVNIDERELTLACVGSLERALLELPGGTEIVVVDNGSSDGSAAALRAAFPHVLVIEVGENRGFPAGVNAGVAASTGEWILLLNNDATIEPDGVRELLAASAGRPAVGMLAARVLFDATGRINSAGFDVDRLGVAYDRHIGSLGHAGETEPTEVFGASGGAALVRRTLLDQLGGLDGSFFLYLEDVDLAWRARMCGWSALYVPTAVVHHRHSASSVHGSPFKHFYVGRNRVRLLAKHMPARDLLRFGPMIAVYDLGYVLFVALTDRTLAPLRGRVSGLRDWRADRARGAGRRRVALAPPQGLSGALRRHRAVVGAGAETRDRRS